MKMDMKEYMAPKMEVIMLSAQRAVLQAISNPEPETPGVDDD